MKNTMKFLTATFMTMTLFLTSCGNNQDYAYNEKITSDFYSLKEQVDDSHQKLIDGGFDVDISNEIDVKMAMNAPKNLKQIAHHIQENAKEIQRSEKANEFDKIITSYFSTIEKDYTTLLENYINEQDSVKRTEIKQNLISKKKELEDLENKSLDAQIKFLNDAGIKINPNQ